MNQRLRFLLIACAMLIGNSAGAADLAVHRARHAATDQCLLYGFTPGSRDYAECRVDVRRYWTTGPCGSSSFAMLHRGYCHLNPPPFI